MSKYIIEETISKHDEQNSGAYLDENFWPNWNETIENFKTKLITCRDNQIPFSLLRISHSEMTLFYYMSGVNKFVGNWERQSNDYTFDSNNYLKFFESINSSDYISTQIGYDFHQWLNDVKNYNNCYLEYKSKNKLVELFNNRTIFQKYNNQYKFTNLINLPMDIIYGLIANKWFFKTFKNKIGLIGSTPKIQTIIELMKYEEYQKYLGTEIFTDYIKIPEKKAMDDSSLEQNIIENVQKSSCDIFLIGAGTSKLKFYHLLKKTKNCIFLDVGHGIDVIAGHCDLLRPYLGGWQNYRLRNKSIIIDKMYADGKDGDIIYL